MKKLLALILAMAMALSLVACGGSSDDGGSDSSSTGDASSSTGDASGSDEAEASTGSTNTETSGTGETITLTVWGAEEDQTLLAELVEGFKETYSDYTFDIQIGVESESTAKDTVLT
ncbi:MAG: ABC transporter substrate-binding protein, partial [Clostridiales bacterium]|nr:ABC transporter substrate-binding protein [Clostridiales bacterium]